MTVFCKAAFHQSASSKEQKIECSMLPNINPFMLRTIWEIRLFSSTLLWWEISQCSYTIPGTRADTSCNSEGINNRRRKSLKKSPSSLCVHIISAAHPKWTLTDAFEVQAKAWRTGENVTRRGNVLMITASLGLSTREKKKHWASSHPASVNDLLSAVLLPRYAFLSRLFIFKMNPNANDRKHLDTAACHKLAWSTALALARSAFQSLTRILYNKIQNKIHLYQCYLHITYCTYVTYLFIFGNDPACRISSWQSLILKTIRRRWIAESLSVAHLYQSEDVISKRQEMGGCTNFCTRHLVALPHFLRWLSDRKLGSCR